MSTAKRALMLNLFIKNTIIHSLQIKDIILNKLEPQTIWFDMSRINLFDFLRALEFRETEFARKDLLFILQPLEHLKNYLAQHESWRNNSFTHLLMMGTFNWNYFTSGIN